MGWFRNRHLVTQLLTLFLALAGITLVIGLVGLGETRKVGGIVADLHDNQLLPVQELDAAYRILTDHYHHVLYAAQTAEGVERDRSLARLGGEKEAFWKVYTTEMATRPAPGEAAVWAQMPAAWAAYEAAVEREAELLRTGRAPEAQRAIAQELRPRFETVRDLLAREITLNVEEARSGFRASRSVLVQARNQTYLAILLGIALAIALGAAFTRYLLTQLGGELAEASRVAAGLAQGDLTCEIDVKHGGASSLMAGMKRLVRNLNQLAAKAEAIGRGDFSTEVEPLSDHDVLGLAIIRMNALLRSGRDQEARRDWLKDGTSALAAALTGDLTLQEVADAAMGTLGRYVGAGRGVLYLDRAGTLELLASYMYSSPSEPARHFAYGEGAIGQVARDRQSIRLAPGTAAPPILRGTSSAPAPCTCTFPIIHEGDLLAVVELASFEPFDPLQEEYLQAASGLIASYLYVALQREKVGALLTLTEQAEAEARAQSRQLQDANARLEEQQQQLQMQTEELRQSYEQLEEQQQQLRTQTEELQQSNSMMEEQQQLLERSNQELRNYQTELDAKAALLEQTNHYKSEFLANMSHELRTPLNAIILLSRMMAGNRGLAPEEAKWAEIIHRSGQDLLVLINDVLDLAKVEAGRMDLHPAELTGQALAAEFADRFTAAAQEKGLDFTIQDRLEEPFPSDPDKLSQILRNLLSNALKFTREGGVTLVMERRAGEPLPLVFAVRDTGIGIAQDKQGLIFEAFHQADGSTTREYGGTGLGLTISLQLARLLGGTIELTSTPGEGSEFALRLPDRIPGVESALESAPSPAKAPAPASHVANADEAGSADASRETILLAGSGGLATETVQDLRPHAKVSQAGFDLALALAERAWQLVIIDLGGRTLEEGLALARTVRQAQPGAAMMFYATRALGEQDEARLRTYSDTTVIQSAMAGRRLMDAMDRFLVPRAEGQGMPLPAARPFSVRPVGRQAPAPESEPGPAPAGTGASLAGRTILVVDDDPRNLFVLTAALETTGARILNAINGRHALEVLAKGTVDLIFLDVMMPELDGYQTLAALKKDARLAAIPVIALTAKAMPQDREQLLQAGADAYLAKPVDFPVLLALAAQWCGAPG